MTHDEYVADIRERFSDLFDPSNSDQDWQFLITIGPGWWPLLSDFCEQLDEGLRRHGETGRWFVRQVKEKMGQMRIYVRPASERLNVDWYPDSTHDIDPSPVQDLLSDLRSQITERANRTCEECGEPGGLRVLDGWYSTCCDRHFQEWQAEKDGR